MIAIEVGISSLGLSHPETAKTIDGMGTTYLSDGQIKFALPYFLLAYKLLTGSLNQNIVMSCSFIITYKLFTKRWR